jgi:hypothetical protein
MFMSECSYDPPEGHPHPPYIYIDPKRGPPVRLARLEADQSRL